MPRRKAAAKREVLPDPLYGSEQVAKFINVIMREGKKSIAEKIVYDAIQLLAERVSRDARASDSSKSKEVSVEESATILEKALTNVAPTVEVKSRRVGGATYQVPVDVARDRGLALAMRWLKQTAEGRGEKTMALRLGAELHDAYMNRGAAIKKREDVHKMAKANQAFAHYRW